MITIADVPRRRQALDPTQSFICEAPAGSGKTELLTQRLLTLLARVEQPEEIIAITFTRKAAAEMRTRVVCALDNAVKNPQPETDHEALTWRLARAVLELDRSRGWNLIAAPARLQIKTFDSLCAALAATLPWHSSFAAPPPVAEDAEELYSAAARSLLASLEQDVPWAPAIATVVSLLDNNTDKLSALLVKMLARREAWLPLLGRGADKDAVLRALEDNLQTVRGETIARLTTAIPGHFHRLLPELGAFAAAQLRRAHRPSPIAECIGLADSLPGADESGVRQWQGLVALLLTNSGEWRRTLDARCGFPLGEGQDEAALCKKKKSRARELIDALSRQADLRALLLEVRDLPSAHYAPEQRQLLFAIIELLPALSAHLTLVFQEQNQVDFAEVCIRAATALGRLGEPTELALALDYKIHHILVDEFQDTSPAQIALLTSLTAGWQPGDGRTLFCVGDAMQSIYSFRDANVGLFLKCMENGLEHLALTPLRLCTNFRSQAGIVEWINAVFSPSFPQRNDISVGAVTYAPSQAFREHGNERAVWVHGFTQADGNDDEAARVLAIIQETRRRQPRASIAVLVRNRHHAMHITPLLELAGLKYRAVDLVPLADHVVVEDLMALSHALLRPQDRIAWLAVLRAPWCGLSLVDLEVIANFSIAQATPLTLLQQARLALEFKPTTEIKISQPDMFAAREAGSAGSRIHLLSDDGRARLRRVLPIVECALAQSRRKPLRQWVQGVWIRLGGPACLQDPSAIKNAELFFALLESLDDNAGLPTRDALHKAVAKLYAAPDPHSDENLQIMTIHKAKGLEFDTVIVPSLHRRPRSHEAELLRWSERVDERGHAQLLMSPITASGNATDPVYAHLATQDKRREAYESCRLLYVACTRAREHLHLLGAVEADKKDPTRLKPPAKTALFFSVWDAIRTQIEVHTERENGARQNVAMKKPKELRRLHVDWQWPDLEVGRLLEQYVPYFDHQNERPRAVQWQDDTQRAVGTLVHRLLKGVDAAQLQCWRGEGLAREKNFYRSQLINLGVPRRRLADAVDRTCAILQCVANDRASHWIFCPRAAQRRPEFALTWHSPEGPMQLAIDLLLIAPDATWVIDYKTSQPLVGEDEREFVQKALAAYREIMFRYREAVASMGFKNVRLALYFPLISHFAEYER